MRAIVLVGGEGTRLRPLTWRTPKALVPVLNQPLLEHLLLHIRDHGVDQVTLALVGKRNTAQNDAIRGAFADGFRLGLRVEYAYEESPLGSGGAIASIARDWDQPFAVCNGDVITDLDLTAMFESHRKRGAELSLSLHEVDDPSPFGVVDMASDGRIDRFVEKPAIEDAPSRLINAGTWLFEPGLVKEMDATTFNRVEERLFPSLAAAGRGIYGFHRRAYWMDVGNPQALLRVNLDLAEKRERDGIVMPRDAMVAMDARVAGPAVLGRECRVEARATVYESLLWDRVTVGAGAAVRRSVLASGVRIGAGAVVEDCVLAHEVTVEAGARLRGAVIEPAGAGAA